MRNATRDLFIKDSLYLSQKKSKALAYLLGAFFGGLGFHRFYLGEMTGGFIYVGLAVFSLLLPPLILITFLYLLFDLFYTSSLCDRVNNGIRAKIEAMSNV